MTCLNLASKFTFLEAENEGVALPRQCTRCKNCTVCSDRNLCLTETENAQLEIIDSKVIVNPVSKKMSVKYPYIVDPILLRVVLSTIKAKQEEC